MGRHHVLACSAVLAIALGLVPPAAGQLSGRPADDWATRLDRPDRIAGLRVDEIIARLGLKPGMVVADLGAGPGIFSVALAKVVGPTGKVYAVEIDKGFFPYIEKKAAEQQVSNVKTVLGQFTDPALPARDVDLGFFHDVLHHIEDRAGYLKALSAYVKPGGRVAIVELDPVKGGHKDEPALQVSKETARGWMAAAGFKPTEEIALFEDKWFVIYTRN